MTRRPLPDVASSAELGRRLREAQNTIDALLSGQIDAVVDPTTKTPVMLAKAQEALRESEERYRRIVETANEGIATIDGDAILTFVNPRFAELLGYTRDELIGTSALRLVPVGAQTNQAQRDRLERARRGLSDESELSLLRKDGTEIWALVKSSPIGDAEGAYVGTLVMLTDKTRSKAAEDSLRKSEEQYRLIVEATSDGIIQIDAHETIVFVNGRLLEMLGYAPGELVGSSVFTITSPSAWAAVADSIAGRRRGARGDFDTTYRHKAGRDVSVNIAGVPLFDEGGTYVGSLGVVRDFTEKNRLRSQLMVSDRMASVGTLAAGVAHEINNPLAAVMVNLDYVTESVRRLRSGSTGPELAQLNDAWIGSKLASPLADAREAARRVRLIVRDLKISSGSPTDEVRGAVDVKGTMESSIRMAWNEIRHRARLVKKFGDVPPVHANEGRLGQVFLNLIVNAAQAIPEGRAQHNEIRVTTRADAEHVVIEVSDTGPGIPPENIDRIFDAFFTTKPVGVGSGLGLAICHRIVTDMGGQLTVTSELGKGATFRMVLPSACAGEATAAEAEVTSPPNGRRARILVVDDETILVRALERMLRSEYEVVGCTSGAGALARIAAGETFDLILCDLMMPVMTGMALHHELSALAPVQAKRMVFMTGGAFTASARQFLAEPPKEHIEKPFDMANLRAIILRHVQMTG